MLFSTYALCSLEMSMLQLLPPVSPPPAVSAVDGRAEFLADVHAGLAQSQKSLPCKYLYDARGAELFDRICELAEYYPTRTETQILTNRLDEIADRVPAGAVLIEYGSGSSLKTRLLLDRLDDLGAYVPVDISASYLDRSAKELRRRYPGLRVEPVCADFTQPSQMPNFGTLPDCEGRPRVLFFPGSTIGNFGPAEATDLLASMAAVVGAGGGLLIGVDLRKSPAILKPAYDDQTGVTADFNINLLVRINRELHGTFNLMAFKHLARWNPVESRMEMHLMSLRSQTVQVQSRRFHFAAGETIHTENSYKYSREAFASLANGAGWHVETLWTDPAALFSVQYLTAQTCEGRSPAERTRPL